MAESLQALAEAAQKLSAGGKFLQAAEKYDEILKLNDEIAEVHLNKGVVLSKAGEDVDALEAFREAAKLKPELVGAHLNEGIMLKRLQRWEEAEDAFRRVVDREPDQASAWANMVLALNAMNEHEAALRTANEAVNAGHRGHPDIHNERILALFKLRRADDAIEDVEALLESKPMEQQGDTERNLYSMILMSHGCKLLSNGDNQEAESYLERACEGHESAVNLFPYGVCLGNQHKDDEAIPVLEKAMALDPSNWRIPVMLATIYMRQKKFDKASEFFERALKQDEAKKDANLNFNYAVALMNTGRESEAKEPLEMVASVDPTNHQALGLLGTVFLQENDFPNAVETLEKAAKLPGAKEDSSIFYNLGYAKLMNDRPEEALEGFEASLKINPDNEQAKTAVKALRPEVLDGSKRVSRRDIADAASAAARERGSVNGKRISRRELERLALDSRSPLERAKLLLGAQRPAYLRRKSMQDLFRVGYVNALAGAFDEITAENIARPTY
mmetsp:Transcript_14948/g.47558  ORF Transcript_14948/g.47558 Transcript_14948/m.47558 type:complete len:503 (+) Transcript_14948:88-1596(+)